MTNPPHLPPLIDISLFYSAITKGTTILVPNQRLVDSINQAWSLIQEHQVWETPQIFTLKTWLKMCWERLQDMTHSEVTELSAMSDEHYRYLWYKAIQKHDPELAANYKDLAKDTEKNIETWLLDAIGFKNESYGSIRFSRWRRTYHELLKKNKIVTQGQIWMIIMKSFKQGDLPQLTSIALYGFQTVSPLEFQTISAATQELSSIDQSLSAINIVRSARSSRNSGLSFTVQSKKLHLPRARRVRCSDESNEVILSAVWAAEELKINKNQRIAIVVSDLGNRLEEIYRVINKIFIARGVKSNVNFSAGTPLISTPIVSAAIDLLNIAGEEKSLSLWLKIIHSPFSAFSQLESNLKIKLENKLSELRQFKIPTRKFLYLFNSLESKGHELHLNLANVLEKNEKQKNANLKMNFSNWTFFFTDVLRSFGWPGDRSLSSIEYQQRKQLFITLETFSKFDNLNVKTNFSEAKTTFESILSNHIFHPQSPDAPLHILGLLEASGLKFNSIWVLGLESRVFPRPTIVNPLLPPTYQRRHGLPGSLPEVEYAISRCLIENYHSNCNSLFLSYPETSGDETLRECSLLEEVIRIEAAQINRINEQAVTVIQESYEDRCETYTQVNIPLSASEMRVSGGTAVLRDQSVCPINAFIIHRLNITYPIDPIQGLDNAQRGILIHETMSKIWNTLKSSIALLRKTDQELNLLIDKTITATFLRHISLFESLRSKNLFALEKNRVKKLIKNWLELETQRNPFEVIHTEKKTKIKLGALSFCLAIDRIDQIGQKLFVIDYKTGTLSPARWNDERLLDPQLPAYVLSVEPHADGVAYAQLNADDLRWIGQSAIDLDMQLEEINDWSGQLANWKEKLMNLANEFEAGDISFVVHDKNRFKHQEFLFPVNRWPELFLITE